MNRILLVLLVIHAGAGAMLWISGQYAQRAAEVAALRTLTEQDRAKTVRIERDIETMEARRAGIRQNDRFVVELLARERLGWVRHDEIPVPKVAQH
jgi:cell division protein FtsB